jgi:radical SAM superfamily enzyme with C-terminal helix-hairpin-helix motif
VRRDLVRKSVLASALFVAMFFAPGAWADGVRHKHGKPPVEGVLNLNRASEAELRLLPGIGRGRAETIVARRQGKPFASLEDVARIKGMRRIVQRLHAHLSVEGATTLRPVAIAKTGPPPDVH